MATKLSRRLEFLERKSARFRNHLHFNLHCKHQGVVPVSLKLKSSVKGITAERILERAQRQLVSERIGQTISTLDSVKNQIATSTSNYLIASRLLFTRKSIIGLRMRTRRNTTIAGHDRKTNSNVCHRAKRMIKTPAVVVRLFR